MDLNPVFIEVTKYVGAITVGAFGEMLRSWWRRRNRLPQGFEKLQELCNRRFGELDKQNSDLAMTLIESKRNADKQIEEMWKDVVGLRVSVARIRGRLKLNGETEH